MVVGRGLLTNTWAHSVNCSTHQHLGKKITWFENIWLPSQIFYCSFWIVAQNAVQLTSAFGLPKCNTAVRKENLSSRERKREFPTSICFVCVPSFCIPWESFKNHDYKTQEGVFGKLKHQTVAPQNILRLIYQKNLLPSELMKPFEHGGVMHRRWRICCSCCVMLGDVPRAHVMLCVTPSPHSVFTQCAPRGFRGHWHGRDEAKERK